MATITPALIAWRKTGVKPLEDDVLTKLAEKCRWERQFSSRLSHNPLLVEDISKNLPTIITELCELREQARALDTASTP